MNYLETVCCVYCNIFKEIESTARRQRPATRHASVPDINIDDVLSSLIELFMTRRRNACSLFLSFLLVQHTCLPRNILILHFLS